MSFYSIQSKKDIHSGFKIPLALYNELNARFEQVKLGNYIDFGDYEKSPYQIRHIGSTLWNGTYDVSDEIEIFFNPSLSGSQKPQTYIYAEVVITGAYGQDTGDEFVVLARKNKNSSIDNPVQKITNWIQDSSFPLTMYLYDVNPPSDGGTYSIVFNMTSFGWIEVNDIQWYVIEKETI